MFLKILLKIQLSYQIRMNKKVSDSIGVNANFDLFAPGLYFRGAHTKVHFFGR